jgi:hypothetical protein
MLDLPAEDTRFARRALRESDGLKGLKPGVALSESGNPRLISSTPSASSDGSAMRKGGIYDQLSPTNTTLDVIHLFLFAALVEELLEGDTVGGGVHG